ncbi:hypothetical protein ACFC8N_10945 [Streptomyces sp. NPDC055966]|uniref:hypothetical protein n=1 Tax=Streptomyces sp. NPDC055966 TaxID=3345669 RepID=UPI0035DF5533
MPESRCRPQRDLAVLTGAPLLLVRLLVSLRLSAERPFAVGIPFVVVAYAGANSRCRSPCSAGRLAPGVSRRGFT